MQGCVQGVRFRVLVLSLPWGVVISVLVWERLLLLPPDVIALFVPGVHLVSTFYCIFMSCLGLLSLLSLKSYIPYTQNRHILTSTLWRYLAIRDGRWWALAIRDGCWWALMIRGGTGGR